MSRPKFITFTGADGHTSINGMADLSRTYPIEWGLLFSPDHQGTGRFPSLDFVAAVLERKDLRLSAHLCGGHSRALVENSGNPKLFWLMRPTPGKFTRIQINTTAPQVPISNLVVWCESRGARLVLQHRLKLFPDEPRCDWLFDRSGGKGQLPLRWPRPSSGRLIGYAGGLAADNVKDQLGMMSSEVPFWIDMETNVRTRDRFDLAKVRAVCEAVYA